MQHHTWQNNNKRHWAPQTGAEVQSRPQPMHAHTDSGPCSRSTMVSVIIWINIDLATQEEWKAELA